MQEIVSGILKFLKDPHPRVRVAAIYALGQLCTELEGALQEHHGVEIIQGFMGTMGDSVPRFVVLLSLVQWRESSC